MSVVQASKKYRIKGFKDKGIQRKLISMGILPGMNLEIIRISTLGSSYYIKAEGQCIAMRRKEFEEIVFE